MRLKYPCLLEVSQSKDFSQDPYTMRNRVQVCIGKMEGLYVCIKSEEHLIVSTLELIKRSIKSGGVSGLTLNFWNYGRIPQKK
jgi:hypothetical protein